MDMEGVSLNPVSDPPPEQVRRDISALQISLNSLVEALQDLQVDARDTPNMLTAEQLQRRFSESLGAFKEYLADAQKLNHTFQSLSDLLQRVQALTTEVERLQTQVNEEHTLSKVTAAIHASQEKTVQAFHDLSTDEYEVARLRNESRVRQGIDTKMDQFQLRAQERTELDIYRRQQSQVDAGQISARERAELDNFRQQKSYLESIQLAVRERSELDNLRQQQPLQLTVRDIQELATLRSERAQFQAVQLSAQDRADLATLRSQQSLQLTVNERAELVSLRNQRQQFNSLQLASNERTQLALLQEENKILREQKVSADKMRLDSSERSELENLRRQANQALTQLGEVHQVVVGTEASEGILHKVDNIENTLSTGKDAEQRNLTTFIPRTLRGISDSMTKVLNIVEKLPTDAESELPHKGRRTNEQLVGSNIIPRAERSSPPQEGHHRRSLSHSSSRASLATHELRHGHFKGAFNAVVRPSRSRTTLTGGSEMDVESTYGARASVVSPLPRVPEHHPFVPPSGPGTIPSRPDPQHGHTADLPVHSRDDIVTIIPVASPASTEITVNVRMSDALASTLRRRPNTVLFDNAIKVGDGSDQIGGYLPFATGLSTAVTKRFVEELVSIICVAVDERYEQLPKDVQKTMCMYNKMLKGGAQAADEYACLSCIRANRICLKKGKLSTTRFVMFIAPLRNPLSPDDLAHWVTDPSKAANLAPTAILSRG
ncbi:hypothetical protein KCU81_g6425, partial [Aureobasidium melanogenum]|uniref:Uncharacterized protein n=1 Tax=Aureobasidium melanogenum (strain CBS 110374) TaxID=1043003 RepID=A0A074VLP7_AURM1